MTLSVGVLCRSWEPPPSTFGITLASDTRYSYPNRRPYDHGEKVFKLGPYAGCAAAASNGTHVFRAVAALERVFHPQTPATAQQVTDEVSRALNGLDSDIVRGGENPGYALIIGTYTQEGEALLLCVGDDEQVDGQEQHADWGVAIGMRQYAGAFDEALRAGIAKTLATGNDLITAEEQALAVGMALRDCVEENRDPGIGGGVQVALITPERGYSQLDLAVWDRESDAIDVATPPLNRGPEHALPSKSVPLDLIRLAAQLKEHEASIDPSGLGRTSSSG